MNLVEEEWCQREVKTRRDLEELVAFVIAAAADAESSKHLTGEERARFVRHRDRFPDSITELTQIILASAPHASDREFRLYMLFEALSSTLVIAGCCINSEAVDRLLNHQRAATAREEKTPDSRRTDEIIIEELKGIRIHVKTKMTPWSAAGEIMPRVNTRLTEEGLKTLSQSAIAKRLGKLWECLSPPKKSDV